MLTPAPAAAGGLGPRRGRRPPVLESAPGRRYSARARHFGGRRSQSWHLGVSKRLLHAATIARRDWPRHPPRRPEGAFVSSTRGQTRTQLRIKALFRGRGISASGQTVYGRKERGEWTSKLPSASRPSAELLWRELDAQRELKKDAEKELERIGDSKPVHQGSKRRLVEWNGRGDDRRSLPLDSGARWQRREPGPTLRGQRRSSRLHSTGVPRTVHAGRKGVLRESLYTTVLAPPTGGECRSDRGVPSRARSGLMGGVRGPSVRRDVRAARRAPKRLRERSREEAPYSARP